MNESLRLRDFYSGQVKVAMIVEGLKLEVSSYIGTVEAAGPEAAGHIFDHFTFYRMQYYATPPTCLIWPPFDISPAVPRRAAG